MFFLCFFLLLAFVCQKTKSRWNVILDSISPFSFGSLSLIHAATSIFCCNATSRLTIFSSHDFSILCEKLIFLYFYSFTFFFLLLHFALRFCWLGEIVFVFSSFSLLFSQILYSGVAWMASNQFGQNLQNFNFIFYVYKSVAKELFKTTRQRNENIQIRKKKEMNDREKEKWLMDEIMYYIHFGFSAVIS